VSSGALRPGVAHGAYPERSATRESRWERTLRMLVGSLARRRQASKARRAEFVRAVDHHGAALRGRSDAKIRAHVQGLRHRFAVRGLADELLAPAFALVREVARRTLGMAHYDVQILGGWVMAQGMLAEMDTGEGKTLTATLPAATAALAGIPVHVVSVNDYLVERDAQEMRPVYEALGLSVGTVIEREPEAPARRAAYACDITYATAKLIAFDYLRDGLERGHRRQASVRLGDLDRTQAAGNGLLLRGLCFAIVDEADSVLVDEARTPLILSGSTGSAGSAEQAKTYRTALRLAGQLEEGIHYRIDRQSRTLAPTERGHERLEELTKALQGIWTGPRRREEWVVRALQAMHLFVRDQHYLVRDGKVQIIDQSTGRVSPDRSWERGLHQLIELKEGCDLTPPNETLARISYQQFFRRYLRLGGMTGTAREVARELESAYRLKTQAVPTRLPVQRRNAGIRVFATRKAKWAAVVERVRELHRRGRPVLVGTW